MEEHCICGNTKTRTLPEVEADHIRDRLALIRSQRCTLAEEEAELNARLTSLSFPAS